MMDNTPTLTSSEEERAPWNDDFGGYYPYVFGRHRRHHYYDEDYDDEDEEDEEDIDEL